MNADPDPAAEDRADPVAAPAARARQAAMPFIMLTVLIDMVSIGLIIPVLPRLVGSFERSAGDLAGAYALPGARWMRTAALARGPVARIQVDDAWRIPDGPGADTFRLLVAGEVALGEDGAVVTPIGPARRLRIGWPSGTVARLVVRELDDPMLTSVWGDRLTRIDLDVSDRDELTVAFTQEEAAA